MPIHKYVRRSTVTTTQEGIPWPKIPTEVREEIGALETYTKDTGREGSITMCKKEGRDRLFVGNDFQGNTEATYALDCDARFGKSSRVGSVHSHPVNSEVVGVLFSESDIVSTVTDSDSNKRRQIDCVTSPSTPLIPCMMPKELMNKKQVRRYQRALENSQKKTDPYFIDNVHSDFYISLFDRDSGNREDEPSPKKVIKAAFGKSNKALREHVKVFERGAFCEYVADLMGQHNRDDVITECREELRKKSFLGLIDY